MIYITIGIIAAIITAMIAYSKGRNAFLWLLYGLLIWPVALVHILLVKGGQDTLAPSGPPKQATTHPHKELPSSACKKCGHNKYEHLRICPYCRYDKLDDPESLYSTERDCPYCAEPIKKKAIKCKHCGSKVEPIGETA